MLGDHIEIPGFPKYRIYRSCVISFHKSERGIIRKLERPSKNNGWQYGYTLFNDGRRKFFSMGEIMSRFIGKETLETLRGICNMEHKSFGIKSGGWIIGSIMKSTGTFSASTTPRCHTSFADAKKEAARLASIDKTKKFAVLKIDAIASINEIVWE